jgi:hypothetical protein
MLPRGRTQWFESGLHHTDITTAWPPNKRISGRPGIVYADMDLTSSREKLDRPTFAASTARSFQPGGFNTLLGDGSDCFIKSTINGRTWRLSGTVAGGEVVSSDSYGAVGRHAGGAGRPGHRRPRVPGNHRGRATTSSGRSPAQERGGHRDDVPGNGAVAGRYAARWRIRQLAWRLLGVQGPALPSGLGRSGVRSMAKRKPPSSHPISRALREAIRERGLTAYAAAKQAGVSVDAVQRFLNQERGLTLATVDKLAGALRLTLCPDEPSSVPNS